MTLVEPINMILKYVNEQIIDSDEEKRVRGMSTRDGGGCLR